MSLNKTIFLALLTIMLIPVAGIGCSNATVINASVDPQTAYKMIQSNQANPNFIIIDIRTQPEFDSGHIAKAIMIDYYLPDFKQKLSELDHNKTYLIYCRTAHRTTDALKIMKQLGFRETYDITGGITNWKAQGYQV
jgi:rhodanese-related sulfurtransferase